VGDKYNRKNPEGVYHIFQLGSTCFAGACIMKPVYFWGNVDGQSFDGLFNNP
jgi:hypothetical protein